MTQAARKRTAQTTKIPMTATTKPKRASTSTTKRRAVSGGKVTPVSRERIVVKPVTRDDVAPLLATPMTLGSTILPPEAQVMTVKELALLLSISERNASALVLRGEIASLKIGQLRRIPLYAVMEYIRSHTGAA